MGVSPKVEEEEVTTTTIAAQSARTVVNGVRVPLTVSYGSTSGRNPELASKAC